MYCAVVRCYSRMRSEGFSFYFGGLGVQTCSLDAASATATVGNRLQPFVTVGNRPQVGRYGRAFGEFCKSGKFMSVLEVSNVAKLRFAWQARYLVTFQYVS